MERLVAESVSSERFERLQHGFERAAARLSDGIEQSSYLFGSQLVRFRIGGEELARQLTRPFHHLRVSEPAGQLARLEVCLWDERETGIVAPTADPPEGMGLEDLTEISVTGRFVQQWRAGSVSSLDRQTGRIVGVFVWNDDLGVYERGKPLARLLAEWYADQGLGIMHAGLVARGDDGVLLAGKEGAGKSTLALACARAGLDFLGEDYAALQFVDDGSVIGHSAYNSVFLTPTAATWFPELAPYLTESRGAHETKSVILLSEIWPSRLRRCVRIGAVAVCQPTDAAAFAVRAATRAEALLAVAPSSLLSIHGRRKDSLDRLARLVERVPCFWLDLSRNLSAVPGCIDELLGRTISS